MNNKGSFPCMGYGYKRGQSCSDISLSHCFVEYIEIMVIKVIPILVLIALASCLQCLHSEKNSKDKSWTVRQLKTVLKQQTTLY